MNDEHLTYKHNPMGQPLCWMCEAVITDKEDSMQFGLCKSCYKQTEERDGIYVD